MRSRQLSTRETQLQLEWAGLRTPFNAKAAKWKVRRDGAHFCSLCRKGKENGTCKAACTQHHVVSGHNRDTGSLPALIPASLSDIGMMSIPSQAAPVEAFQISVRKAADKLVGIGETEERRMMAKLKRTEGGKTDRSGGRAIAACGD